MSKYLKIFAVSVASGALAADDTQTENFESTKKRKAADAEASEELTNLASVPLPNHIEDVSIIWVKSFESELETDRIEFERYGFDQRRVSHESVTRSRVECMSQCSRQHMDKVAKELQALAHEVRGIDDLHLLVDAFSRGTVALRQATEDTSCEKLSWKFQAALGILEWGVAEDRKLAKPFKKKAKIKVEPALELQSPYFPNPKMHELYWRLQRRHQAVIDKLRRENDIPGMQIQISFYQEMLLATKRDAIDALRLRSERSTRHIIDIEKALGKQKVLPVENQTDIELINSMAKKLNEFYRRNEKAS